MFTVALSKCVSLHPGEPPLFVPTGPANSEYLLCIISVITNAFSVYAVRHSAVFRLRAAVERPHSRSCFARLPPSACRLIPFDRGASRVSHCEQDELSLTCYLKARAARTFAFE